MMLKKCIQSFGEENYVKIKDKNGNSGSWGCGIYGIESYQNVVSNFYPVPYIATSAYINKSDLQVIS